MRVLVLGAGGPAGVNTCRALMAHGHEVFALDRNERHYGWLKELGVRTGITYPDDIDVVMPQPDALVRELAATNRARTFLPRLEVIDRCQAKNQAATIWHRAGLRGPALPVVDPYPDTLHLAADELGLPFWLRATRGAGANKAIRVDQLGTGYHWIRFWESRGQQVEWIAEPYLPGRDLAWSSIWYDGELVTCFLRERLEYLYPHLSPEGLTGTPTIASVVHDLEVTDIATRAVLTVDDRPHGIYSVDLREDADGVARPTEINAGRGFTTLGLWSLYDVNFVDIAAHCALEPPEYRWLDPLPDGLTLSRHIDCGHIFTNVQVYA